MIETAQWIAQVAETARIERQTAEVIWNKLTALTVQRLTSEYSDASATLPGITALSVCKKDEFVARLANGEIWLMPPHIELIAVPLTKQGADLTTRLLTELLSYTKETIESFNNAMGRLFAECMRLGYDIQWQHLGTIAPSPEGATAIFTPCKELSDAVNRPFSALTPMRLRINISLSDLPERSFDSLNEALRQEALEIPVAPSKPTPPPLPPSLCTPPPVQRVLPPPIPMLVRPTQSRERAHSRWWLFVLIPLALLLLAFLLYLFIRTDDASSRSERARKAEDPTTERYEPPVEQMQTDSISPADSAIIPIPETEEKAPAPVQTPSQTTKTAKATTSNRAFSSQVKTKPDAGRQLYTLKDGETLATVAQSVYGHSNFWIYIYNANRDKLSDPDSVRPGLTLTLPPLRDWGISASDPEAVRRAGELCEREKKK